MGKLKRKIWIFILILAGLTLGCCSSTSGNPDSAAPTGTVKANASAPAKPYFSGTGGKGISIAVLSPDPKNLGSDDSYFPTFIQGIVSDDLTRFSKMSVMNWQSLEKVLKQTESMVYADDSNVVQAGQVTQTQFILSGNLVKTGNSYNLQLNVTDTKSGMNKASYTANCSRQSIKDMSAVAKASERILTEMGVNLTDEGRNALLAVNNDTASANTALALGTIAQRQGSTIDAMGNFYDALELDPDLSAADERLQVVSAPVSSGHIGEDIRNDIKQRAAWLKLMSDCNDYFKARLPCTIVYDVSKLSADDTDYQSGTASFSLPIALVPTNQWNMPNKILQGLFATGKALQWGIVDWPLHDVSGADIATDGFANDEVGNSEWGPFIKLKAAHFGSRNGQSDEYIPAPDNAGLDGPLGTSRYARKVTINAVLLNDAGKVIGLSTTVLDLNVGFPALFQRTGRPNMIYDDSRVVATPTSGVMVFPSVNANDITDKMSIEIRKVDGHAADSLYARIVNAPLSAVPVQAYVDELNGFGEKIAPGGGEEAWKTYEQQWLMRRDPRYAKMQAKMKALKEGR